MKKTTLKCAIIGSEGFIAQRHMDAIKEISGVIITTCDIDKSKNADFTDYRAMLQDEIMRMVNCIVICTPNYLHAEMARDCLRTGKIVLVEKPLCINTDFTGLDGVNVCHQLRYHPQFDEIKESLLSARSVRMVMRAYRDKNFWNSWKGDEQMSGGVVYILGSHLIDLMVACLGGNNWQIIEAKDTMKKSIGIINFEGIEIEFLFEILDTREGQGRWIDIDGRIFTLSLRDNLSFEGLHDKIYLNMLQRKGVKLEDAKKSIIILDAIKKIGR